MFAWALPVVFRVERYCHFFTRCRRYQWHFISNSLPKSTRRYRVEWQKLRCCKSKVVFVFFFFFFYGGEVVTRAINTGSPQASRSVEDRKTFINRLYSNVLVSCSYTKRIPAVITLFPWISALVLKSNVVQNGGEYIKGGRSLRTKYFSESSSRKLEPLFSVWLQRYHQKSFVNACYAG